MINNRNEALKGSVALVTGASRLKGIGAAICKELASLGSDIFFTYWKRYDASMPWSVEDDEPMILKKELENLGVRCQCAELDLSDINACTKLIKIVDDALGYPNILINNACYSVNDTFEDITAESLDAHYSINIRATTLLSAEFAKGFSSGKGGRIINLTSGQSSGPMPDELSYAITKGAIETITYTMAAGIAHKGITVNAVNPGATDTGWMTEELQKELIQRFPFGRIGKPEDAARLIAFLASEEAQWITGQIIHSEGGFKR
jgi:3-oxoacyl-[acyl-carrier protein] reductase